jgi:hypothetical protein
MMKKFFQRLFKKATGKSNPDKRDVQQPRHESMPMQQDMPQQLLQVIQQTEEVEYSCDDVYRLMDQYVELVKRGEDTASLMPLVEHHLKMCPDCREEVEALLRVLDQDLPR